MRPVILFRNTLAEEGELAIAEQHFPIITQRTGARRDDLVIGRYSVLPYYEELETDLTNIGAALINSYKGHRYIANLEEWYVDLEVCTPHTWFFGPADLPTAGGPYVLKGRTNSRKDRWKTLMFAPDKRAAIDIYSRLMDDCLIQPQGVVIRQYIPLVNYPVENIAGSPVTKEFRFFVFHGKVLTGGFYWSNFVEELQTHVLAPTEADLQAAWAYVQQKVIPLVRPVYAGGPTFYVVDVAEMQRGGWMVVELNDGQMSGLSDVKPAELYTLLAQALR